MWGALWVAFANNSNKPTFKRLKIDYRGVLKEKWTLEQSQFWKITSCTNQNHVLYPFCSLLNTGWFLSNYHCYLGLHLPVVAKTSTRTEVSPLIAVTTKSWQPDQIDIFVKTWVILPRESDKFPLVCTDVYRVNGILTIYTRWQLSTPTVHFVYFCCKVPSGCAFC